jgi:carboxymethylenebutenolidase
MDAPGIREELRDMARRLAAVGYFVVLPNLYYRLTRDFWLTERTEQMMAHMFSLMATLDAATTLCDTDAMLRFVDASPAADGRRIGAVGYCMSGPFVMWAAAEFPERIGCIASIHGANMATDAPDLGGVEPKRALFTYWALGSKEMVGVEFLRERILVAFCGSTGNRRLQFRDCFG